MSCKKTISLQVGALLIVCWCTVVLLIGNITRLGFSGWFSFLYVPACVVVTFFFGAVYKPPKNDSSTSGIPLYYSCFLLLGAICINAIYIFTGVSNLGPFVISADILLLAIYIGIILFVSIYGKKLSWKIQKVQSNTSFSSSVSKALGTMLAAVDDFDIHDALLHLKEKVDYSTNSSQHYENEANILSLIDKLTNAIQRSGDKEDIIKMISGIDSFWKVRNTKL